VRITYPLEFDGKARIVLADVNWNYAPFKLVGQAQGVSGSEWESGHCDGGKEIEVKAIVVTAASRRRVKVHLLTSWNSTSHSIVARQATRQKISNAIKV
jgi:hypothetical protein